MLNKLSRLVSLTGVSGSEGDVAGAISEMCAPYADELYSDALGNLIVRKRSAGPKLMLCAHMDTGGIVVTNLESSGLIRFSVVGGQKPDELVNARVRFSKGLEGLIRTDSKSKELRASDLYIDLGFLSGEEAEKHIAIGDAAAFSGSLTERGEVLLGPGLNSRLGCCVLIQLLSEIRKFRFDLYFVFAAQSLLGGRGAKTAAYAIEPEYAVLVGAAKVQEGGNSGRNPRIKPGGGVALRLFDGGGMSDRALSGSLLELAAKSGLGCEIDATGDRSTDLAQVYRSGSSVASCSLGIPLRYFNSQAELAAKSDAETCVRLLSEFIAKGV